MPSISDLPDDILLHMFQYFGNSQFRLKLGDVNWRWFALSAQEWISRSHLALVSSRAQRQPHPSEFLAFPTNCVVPILRRSQNLESLKLRLLSLHLLDLVRVSTIFAPRLAAVDFNSCTFCLPRNIDEAGQQFATMFDEVLHLVELVWQHVHLKQLRDGKMRYCYFPLEILLISHVGASLQRLQLSNVTIQKKPLSANILELAFTNLRGIEALILGGEVYLLGYTESEAYAALAKLNSLRELCCCTVFISEDGKPHSASLLFKMPELAAVASESWKNLEVLFVGFCKGFSWNCLLSFTGSLQMLRFLFLCDNEWYIGELSAELRERLTRGNDMAQLHIFVYGDLFRTVQQLSPTGSENPNVMEIPGSRAFADVSVKPEDYRNRLSPADFTHLFEGGSWIMAQLIKGGQVGQDFWVKGQMLWGHRFE